ncbi:hypothetical protein [Magnetospirillum aberrantis]|uniref:hypothetical protein n=1 Tax=Magnetospirillum aberrantis TaxID=1105283 RepID=UPI001F11E38A|nr:hypothetical protein [Magnetospirillum aberrantis]
MRGDDRWFAGVPRQIAAHAEAQGGAARVHMDPAGFGQEAIDSGVLNIVNVPGDGGTQRTSAGAFLNFATTNLWKNQQVNRFIAMVEAGLVRNGDKVLVTDPHPQHPVYPYAPLVRTEMTIPRSQAAR